MHTKISALLKIRRKICQINKYMYPKSALMFSFITLYAMYDGEAARRVVIFQAVKCGRAVVSVDTVC